MNLVIKGAGALCFFLIGIGVLVAWNSPATGYETSIYASTPLITWICLGISIAVGIAIVVHQVATNNYESSYLWTIGLVLVIASILIIISLHVIRGYYFQNGGGDSGTHMSTISGIIIRGQIHSWDYYPAHTIHIAGLSIVSNIAPIWIMNIMPAFAAALSIGFSWLLAKAVMPNKQTVILSVLVFTVILLGIVVPYTTPWMLSYLMFPLALFILIKSLKAGAWAWRALLLLIVAFFPISHPVSAATLAITLATVTFIAIAYRLALKGKKKGYGAAFSLAALMLLGIWTAIWLSPFSYYASVIPWPFSQIVSTFPHIPSVSTSSPASYSSSVQLFTLWVTTQLEYAGRYGYSWIGSLLCGGIAAITAGNIINSIRSNIRKERSSIIYLCGVITAIALVALLLHFVATPTSSGRIVPYILLILMPLAGIGLYKILCKQSGRTLNIAVVCIVILLIATAFGRAFTVYRSPYTSTVSYHTTESWINGMGWFFSYTDDTEKPTVDLYAYCVIAARWLGIGSLPFPDPGYWSGDDRLINPQQMLTPLYHFGYKEDSMMGEYYTEETYLIMNEEMAKAVYSEVLPELSEVCFIVPDDFDRLEIDRSLDRVYNNGSIGVWCIHPVA